MIYELQLTLKVPSKYKANSLLMTGLVGRQKATQEIEG